MSESFSLLPYYDVTSLKAMSAHEKDAAVQLHGCLALQRLVMSDRILDANVVQVFGAVFRDHANDNNVQLHATRLVHALLLSDSISAHNKIKVLLYFTTRLCWWMIPDSTGVLWLDTSTHAIQPALSMVRW